MHNQQELFHIALNVLYWVAGISLTIWLAFGYFTMSDHMINDSKAKSSIIMSDGNNDREIYTRGEVLSSIMDMGEGIEIYIDSHKIPEELKDGLREDNAKALEQLNAMLGSTDTFRVCNTYNENNDLIRVTYQR